MSARRKGENFVAWKQRQRAEKIGKGGRTGRPSGSVTMPALTEKKRSKGFTKKAKSWGFADF